jgi:hypothetical protein
LQSPGQDCPIAGAANSTNSRTAVRIPSTLHDGISWGNAAAVYLRAKLW